MATQITTAALKGELKGTLTKDGDLGDGSQATSFSKSCSFTNGGGADKVNMIWSDERSLANGANEELDLYASLTDIFGGAINSDVIRGIAVANLSTNNTLLVGGAAANAWAAMFGDTSDKLKLQPATSNNPSFFVMSAPGATGFAVTSGTADLLKLENGSEVAEALSYQIALLIENS